jgi:hypothetical protein
VIGLQQQRGGMAERLVQCEPRRVGMAMRADDRQVRDFGVEFARDRPYAGFGGEQAVGVQGQLAGQRFLQLVF